MLGGLNVVAKPLKGRKICFIQKNTDIILLKQNQMNYKLIILKRSHCLMPLSSNTVSARTTSPTKRSIWHLYLSLEILVFLSSP